MKKKIYLISFSCIGRCTPAVGCLTGCGKMDEHLEWKMTAVTLNEVAPFHFMPTICSD